jgi:hypothetical protein
MFGSFFTHPYGKAAATDDSAHRRMTPESDQQPEVYGLLPQWHLLHFS